MARSIPTSTASEDTVLTSPSRTRSLNTSEKPKKPPPITPRRFKKFFTPRPSHDNTSRVRTSRRALQDITRHTLNIKGPGKGSALFGDVLPPRAEANGGTHGKNRKRKLSFSSMDATPSSSPLRKAHFDPASSQEISDVDENLESYNMPPEEEVDDDSTDSDSWQREPSIRQAREQAIGSICLLGSRIGGQRRHRFFERIPDWQDETGKFYTRPSDSHRCNSVNTQHLVLPFCVASCNSEFTPEYSIMELTSGSANSLVAIGDEEGSVRLLDSSPGDAKGFGQVYLSMRVHENAVMDLVFAEDDSILASASGDQTARVVDMSTQQVVFRLAGHSSTIKKVQFQPDSGTNVLATSSRDGSIKLWDLRCASTDRAAVNLPISIPLDGRPDLAPPSSPFIHAINTIREAHTGRSQAIKRQARDVKRESSVWRDDVSVTSIAFLSKSRNYFIASASEADACVKLWDLRTAHTSRTSAALPIATTRTPASHESHRQFGVTSITFNGDFSRLYTVCRDHTVYVYSTSHLVLGHAPELLPSANPFASRRKNGSNLSGLGPLYGYRHAQLQVGSFYVKASVRQAAGSDTEILAVGSSKNSAILFPTSEGYLERLSKSYSSAPAPLRSARTAQGPQNDVRVQSSSSTLKPEDDTPVYEFGTALIEGHNKEVTGVSWTSDGELVTISDDISARCWREDKHVVNAGAGGEARALRRHRGQGRRWMSGWADVSPGWDENEEAGS